MSAKVSIVINTYNRRETLECTLLSLQALRYRNFEVVVVDGPSTDGTDELLEAWKGKVKLAKCPEANLSKSRNIGIDHAAGDIVAFIDDDAIPHPCWLDHIVAGYDSDDIGGVGGFTYDHTGHAFQAKYIVADRLGGAEVQLDYDPSYAFSVPRAPKFSAHLGTNSTFRRSALVAIGGFDEEYAYYLDETDTCLRMVDAGYVIRQVPLARVYHKFARSHLRSERRILTDRYQILKNQAYFAMRHASEVLGYSAAIAAVAQFVEKHRDDVNWAVNHDLLPPKAKADYEAAVTRAVDDGVRRAAAARPVVWNGRARPPAFRPFPDNAVAKDRLTICLLTQQFRPGDADGIGRFVGELADGLAAEGHTVHVLTRSSGHSTVDLEDGVWVHRLEVPAIPSPRKDIPAQVWSYSAAMLAELREIAELDPIDIVQAPAWDCEGLAVLLDRRFRLVTSIHTPMLVAASMKPDWLVSDAMMRSSIQPIAEWERRLFLLSDGVYANSRGCVQEIEAAYSLHLGARPMAVVPHGLADRAERDVPAPTPDRTWLDVLFVGRLEHRKGIDLVLAAADRLLPEFPDLRMHVVGAAPSEKKNPVLAWKKTADAEREAWRDRLFYYGRAEQGAVDDMLARCDVFVAPSRFESFGLVYVEAMMHGKPVVGSAIGGIAEVVEDGVTGLLVSPGDSIAFTEALRSLLRSEELRARLGEGGRERYLARFTARTMARDSLAFYRRVIAGAGDAGFAAVGAKRAGAALRRCDLDSFVPNPSEASVLEQVCGQALDYRGWAFAQGVEVARQLGARDRSRAVVVGPPGAPAIEDFAPGWRTQHVMVRSPGGAGQGVADRFVSGSVMDKLPMSAADLLLHLELLPAAEGDLEHRLANLRRSCKPGATVLTLLALPASSGEARTQGEALARALGASGYLVPADLVGQLAAAAGRPYGAESADAADPHITAPVNGSTCSVASLQLQVK